jgi:alcohol dehydrogenase
MLAVTTHGDGAVQLVDVERPEIIDPHDVLLKITAAAICGTDLHFVRHPMLPPGSILGHEFVGVIEEVGDGVRGFSLGQRVLSKMFVACGVCPACLAGRQPQCVEYQLFGGGQLDGGQAEYVRVPRADTTLSPVDADMSDASALVLTDILPTAYEALRKTEFKAGDTVAVIGSGPVGLLIGQLSLAAGAAAVYTVDVDSTRLERAGQLGATPVPGGPDAAEEIVRLNGGQRVDIAFDAVGSPAAVRTAERAVATGGRLGLVGVIAQGDLGLTAEETWVRSLTIVPITGNPYVSIDPLRALIRSGRIDPGIVIDHEANLSDAIDTYAEFQARKITKAILRP